MNTALIQGLRDLASWFEAHPEAPEVYISEVVFLSGPEAPAIARLMAPCEKVWGDNLLSLTRAFGPVRLISRHWRSEVCTRRVVGTREIPAEPARPARTEEIVEWDCHPLLDMTEIINRTRYSTETAVLLADEAPPRGSKIPF